MTDTQQAGKRDWVAIGGLVLAALTALMTALAVPLLYLNTTLHQIDVRLTRIETVLGVDSPEIKLGAR